MQQVPPLTPCPTCGVRIEAGSGPAGLAWHACPDELVGSLQDDAVSAAEGLIRATLADPEADMPALLREHCRGLLLRLHRDNEGSGRDVGEMLAGVAKLRGAGGEDDSVRAEFMRWLGEE